MRSHLVKGETLSKKAIEIDIIKFIKLSKGTALLSETRKHSILEGCVESIIGAVFLDSNWKQSLKFILNLFKHELANIKVDQEFRDSKTELQELLQSKKLELPKYITTESNIGFVCKILIDNQKFTGSGNSKRHSEIAVAKEALKYLKSKMDKNYCGYVSIIGKPNVGKSTIINTILDKKVSITSRKSQTTRNNILGIKNIKNKQMIFIDTPGMHIKSQKTMNKILNKSAQGIIEDSDIILFVLQRLSLDQQDKLILEKLNKINPKIICVINKIDQVEDKNKLLPFIARLSEEYAFEEIHMISAKHNDGIDNLLKTIENHLPENNHIYDDGFKLQAKDDSFMFSELIREKIIRKLGDELPHDTFVEIDLIKEKEGIIKVHAIIYVSRQSQNKLLLAPRERF